MCQNKYTIKDDNQFGKLPRKPWKDPYKKRLPDPEPLPKRPKSDEIICPHCGKPSGWPRILWMVIPPDGLACKKCGKIVIKGTRFWC